MFTCFQVEYGMPSSPGAEEGEHFDKAVDISSPASRGAFLFRLSLRGGENASLGLKKWSRSTLFLCSWFSASGREGNRGEARPDAKNLAVHRLCGVASKRKDDQCLFFALLIALKYPALDR